MAEMAGTNFSDIDVGGLSCNSQSAEHFTCSHAKAAELATEGLLATYSMTSRPCVAYPPNGLLCTTPPYVACYAAAAGIGRVPALLADCANETTYSSSEEEILSNRDLTLDKDEIARDLLLTRGEGHDRETSVSDLITVLDMRSAVVTRPEDAGRVEPQPVPIVPSSCNATATSADLPSCHDDDINDADDDDSGSADIEDDSWSMSISVGSEHQAVLPDLMATPANDSDDSDPGEDRLLWDPSGLPEASVVAYCCEINSRLLQFDINRPGPDGSVYTKDSEQALLILLECSYNLRAALQRFQLEAVPPTDPLTSWSPDEQANFISGLRLYGKDFYLIHQNKVRTRSVAELVEYYYLWKKTDRYTAFISRAADRSSSTDTSAGDLITPPPCDQIHREWPTSPGFRTLLYADAKRHDHHMSTSSGATEITSTPLPASGGTPFHAMTPSWMLSPAHQLVDFPQHHQSLPHHHYDMVAEQQQSYQEMYADGSIDPMSAPFAPPVFMSDGSAPGYVNGYVDQCHYFSPYHASIAPPTMDYFGDATADGFEPKKYCSGLVDFSMMHSSSGEFFPPGIKSSLFCPSPSSSAVSFGPFAHHYVTSTESAESISRNDSSLYSCASSEMIAQ